MVAYLIENKSNCQGDCDVVVSGVFKFYDSYYLLGETDYWENAKIKIDGGKVVVVGSFSNHVPEFGKFQFTRNPKKYKDVYFFSPMVYNPYKAKYRGQVLKNKENKYFSVLKIGDNVYFASEAKYKGDCSFDFGVD